MQSMTGFVAGLVLVFTMSFASAATISNVGEIQFVLGQQSYVMRSNEKVDANKGLMLHEGDEMFTGASSFIQIRMDDGALVSLRPNSQLRIDCYQSNLVKGDICLKFSLIKGQVRKVSGSAGKSDPEKYRLNTPVAAIGIRGTDFVASIQDEKSLLKVVEGAITVSPFVENCLQAGFGACHTTLTTLLSEHDTHLLEVNPGQAPRMVQFFSEEGENELSGKDKGSSMNQQAVKNNSVSSEKLQVLSGNEGLVNRFISQVSQQEEHGQKNADWTGDVIPVGAKGPDLIFGTWSGYSTGIAVPYLQAKSGREVTVGNVAGALWRATGDYSPPQAGSVNYLMTDSDAYVNNNGQLISAEVVDGSLSVDFNREVLKAQMQIDVANQQSVMYSATHDLSEGNGVFANTTESGRIGAGAISNDGSNVGYMLSQEISSGLLNASTLWQATSETGQIE